MNLGTTVKRTYTKDLVRRLMGVMLPLKWPILLSLALGTATVGASVGLMGTAAWLIATAALHPSIADLQVAIVGVRFFGVSRGIFRYGERLMSHELTFKLLARLRVWFIERLAPLAPARLLDNSVGDLLDRAVGDIETLQSFFIRILFPPLVAVAIAVGVGFFLAWFSVGAAIAFALFYILAGVVVPSVSWVSARTEGRRSAAVRSAIADAVVDFAQGLSELLASDRCRSHRSMIKGFRLDLSKIERQAALSDAFTTGAGILLTHLSTVVILIITIPLVRSGRLNGVMFAVLCLVAVAAFEAVVPLPEAARQLQHQMASATRLFEILNSSPSVSNPVDPSTPSWDQPDQSSHSLIFRGISHTYPGSSRPALSGLDLVLDPGACVGVVGPSGAGKTTLAHLVQRFWDPTAGRILINGINIKNLDLDDLRRSIGVVSQNTFLFSGTLADNLRLALPSASTSQLKTACRHAALERTIAGMPEGLDTWIGEQGQRLSGGQRQRLSVARALLQKPAILILDEPTAQLDGPTGALLLQQVFEVFAATTTLHITHRLVRMEHYDTIFVLDKGRMVQQGTHTDLIGCDGLYRRLWEAEHSML
jgi:thiol reductant ABC exporter CydC subunit